MSRPRDAHGRFLPTCWPHRETGFVYLLHFDRPLAHAQHYVGYARNLDQRLAMHQAGRGARLMAALKAAGIGYTVARTWLGDRYFERRLHKRHGARRFCPICTPHCEASLKEKTSLAAKVSVL